MKKNSALIFDAQKINNIIQRISFQIFENNNHANEIVLVGIESNGAIIGERIKEKLISITDIPVLFVKMKINKKNPNDKIKLISNSTIPSNKSIILIDDVLNTGKTLMYASKFLLDYTPTKLQSVTLVNRSHREYPISSDFNGISLSTSINEHVEVVLDSIKEGIYLH